MKTLTNKLKFSTDGTCPVCDNKEDWKLASVVYSSGMINIETKTEGKGSNIGFGLGRGHGGIGVDFEDYDEETTGTHQSEFSKKYSPPFQPKELKDEEQLVCTIYSTKKNLEKVILNIKQLAHKPGCKREKIIFNFDNDIYHYRSKLKADIEDLKKIYSYKIWEKSRVCLRCGVQFLLEKEIAHIIDPLISNNFNGSEQYCPNCGSFEWKDANTYHLSKINKIKKLIYEYEHKINKIESNKKSFSKGSILAKIKININDIQYKLLKFQMDKHSNDLVKILSDHPYEDYEKYSEQWSHARMCLSCHKLYLISKLILFQVNKILNKNGCLH